MSSGPKLPYWTKVTRHWKYVNRAGHETVPNFKQDTSNIITVNKGKDLALWNGTRKHTGIDWRNIAGSFLFLLFGSVWVWNTVVAKYPHSF